ncbi:MAG: cytochrome c biogenesis protein CcdA [Anaerolineae bacterium]|nr:cytochrome c biogenesis protein CcdA [Anaerolineae bacterium]MCI0610184.1 cytochrome c biogenesis protein CcdA [Anaerolineae bacterium]
MNGVNLAFAFTAGMLATLNPCGWAMLPTFVSYYLGSREAGYEQRTFTNRAAEGLSLGVTVTVGFLTIFGIVGGIVSAGLRLIVQYMPFAALMTGVVLLLLGLWLLAGKSLPYSLPVPQVGNSRAHNPKSAFVFGIGYAFASLSCTLPVFLAILGASLTASGITAGALMFSAYALGMATVLVGVALGTALLKGAIAQWFRKFLPYVYRISAAMLVLAGLYLIWYQGRYLPLILK